MIKDILLVVENSALANSTIRAAVKIAERRGADLTIEVLTPTPLLVPSLAPMTTMYVPDWSLAADEAERIKKIYEMVGGSSSVVRVLGLRDDVFALAHRAGRLGPIADLVLMGGESHWETEWLRRGASETVVMGSGGPLLILAMDGILPPIHNAVFGWKDSPEARRTVHDLTRLAEPGAKISVVTVGAEYDEPSVISEGANEVVRHFVRHGFQAEWKHLTNGDLTDAEVLEEHALAGKADVLAIGAFAHSWLKEKVFGGVTRTLLDKPRLPILASR